MERLSPTLLFLSALPGLVIAVNAAPKGCDFGDRVTQNATVACFEDVDVNGDGSLSRQELSQLPRTRGRLDELDVDGNGGITPDEFQDGLNTLPQRYGGKGV
jgi:Ca2+-binding EF-hand superfamily protein